MSGRRDDALLILDMIEAAEHLLAETRDRIVHHYEGVDWAIVDSIIELELAALVGALRSALVSLPTGQTRL
jgi:uncharacterized protein YutE (UPF0331/DUF86 family)